MAARYLLDTNTASYVIKGNVPGVRERLARLGPTDVFISVITESEFRIGVLRRPDATKLEILVEEFLRLVEIKSWDSAAARHCAELRATFDPDGEPMGNLDMMIAAHALGTGRGACYKRPRVWSGQRIKGGKTGRGHNVNPPRVMSFRAEHPAESRTCPE